MVKIRLLKQGAKKRPYYKVVVANSVSPRDGRFIEIVGRYQPMNDAEPVVLNTERIEYWIKNGAQPTKTVDDIIRKQKKAAK